MVEAWHQNHPGQAFEPEDPDIRRGIIHGNTREVRQAARAIAALPLSRPITGIKDHLDRK